MFSERMALEATLRRERVTTEARVYEGLRPYRRRRGWQGRLLSWLGAWFLGRRRGLQGAGKAKDRVAARGFPLRRRYRQAGAKLAVADTKRLEQSL